MTERLLSVEEAAQMLGRPTHAIYRLVERQRIPYRKDGRRLVDQFSAEVCARVPGFYLAERDGKKWWTLAGAAGLLVPVRDPEGHIVALKVRADDPGNGQKYTTISSSKHGGSSPGAQVHVPLHTGEPSNALCLTEGELKADVATVISGMLTISMPGVAMWRLALSVLQHLTVRTVRLAFDADWRTNPHVAQAMSACAFALVESGFAVEVEIWDPTDGKGIDDLLAAGHSPRIESVALAFSAGILGRARVGARRFQAEEATPWRP